MLKIIPLFFLLSVFTIQAGELIAFKNKNNIYFIFDNGANTPEKNYPYVFVMGSCLQKSNICPIVIDQNGDVVDTLLSLANFDMSHSKVVKIPRFSAYGSKVDLDWIKEWHKLKQGEYKIKFRYMDWKTNKHIDSNFVSFKID